MLEITYLNTEELIPYARNSRTHSDAQVSQIMGSIKQFGFTNPILVDEDGGIIAGHGRLLAAQRLGMATVPTITLHGLSETQRRAYVIADNKLALNAGWDEEMLKLELQDLGELGFDIDLTGFSTDEIGALDLEFKELNDECSHENPYSQKIDTPKYEPKGEKPEISDLFSDEKAMGLIYDINQSNLSKEEKRFLLAAASRHIVFDYSKIANFYSHSSQECQKLMEDSALVIVDFNKAIELGFVMLSNQINELLDNESE